MSFAYSAGVITQTGTDTDLTGISGLTGVTTITSDPSALQTGYRIYQVDASTRVDITGTLTIEPDVEQLIIEGAAVSGITANPLLVSSGGTLNLGVAKSGNGNTIYSQGVGLNFTAKGSNNFGVFGTAIVSGGTLNWNGGVIRTGSTFRCNEGATVTVNKGTFFNTSDNTAMQFRVTTTTTGGDANINLNDLTLDGLTQQARIFTTSGWNTGVFTFLRGEFQTYNGSAPELTLNDFEVSSNAHTSDFQTSTDAAANAEDITIQNMSRRLNYSTSSGRNMYVPNRRQLATTITDLADAGINYSYYAIDVNNGSRGTGPLFPIDGTQDDTADKVYSGINQSGTITDNVYIEIARLLEGGTANIITDDRTINASSTATYGTLNFNIIGYNEGIGTYNPNLIGTSALTESVKLVPDASITQATKATVDAYTTLDDAFELYDRAKSDLYDNFVGETATTVSRAGSQIELTDINLVIDATAGLAYALAAGTITAKSSTFTGGATATTGTVTTTNGTLLNGGAFDCDVSYDSGAGTTLTNITCTGVMDFTTAGTYTISGGTIAEVTNSSGGAVILNLEGVGVVTTNTGPSITVNAATATLTFVNMTSSTVEIFNDSGVAVSRVSAQSSPYSYQPPAGSTGNWAFIADRVGYAPLRGSFSATGDNATLDVDISQLLKSDNTPQYSGGTYPLITVVYDFVAPCMCINIANGIVTCQQVMDASEDALLTANGMRWQKEQNSLVRFDNLPGVGNILFFGINIRVKRASAGDVNSGVSGYISSIDGVVVDGANGGVSYVGGIDISALALEATLTTKASQASVDALPSAVPSAVENADAVWAKTI